MPSQNNSESNRRQPARPAGHRGRGAVDKPRDFWGTGKRLIGYMKPYWKQLIAVMIMVAISTVLSVASPKLLGNITNQITNDYIDLKVYEAIHDRLPKGVNLPDGTTLEDLQKMMPAGANGSQQKYENVSISDSQRERITKLDITKRPGLHVDAIGRIAITLIIFYVASAIFCYAEAWVETNITQRVAYRLRRQLSDKINSMPLDYFDHHEFGDVMSRITNDVDTVSQSLSQVVSEVVYCLASIIGTVIMMLSINASLTLVALVTIPVSAIAVGLIVSHSQKYFKKQQDTLGDLNGHIEEVYSGHNVVKIFATEAKTGARFNYYNNNLYKSSWRARFISGITFPIINLIGNIGYAAVAVMGGRMVIDGRLSIGDIQAFIQYVSRLNQPIVQLSNVTNVAQSTVAAAERVFEFLDEKDEIVTWEGDGEIIENVQGYVDFDHVKFSYQKGKPIIHDFCAHVKPGQKVAIVGPTGAGKTTVINLLMRFYDPDSGTIKLDHVDTKKISRANVRKQFGMVLQDTWLFHGTIKENLLYGKPDATDDDLKRAVKAARAEHIIRALPKGYNTILDENADNVSAGEKQLLTITRAMLANAPILILDEATSNVDTRTEELIQDAMDELMKGRTSFVIAHRLSTIRDADLILVMNHGDIIETGTHDSLMKQSGFYAKLYNSQFEAA